jgi:hypothetical protein
MKLSVLTDMFKAFAISLYCVLPNQIKARLEVKATDSKNRFGTGGGPALWVHSVPRVTAILGVGITEQEPAYQQEQVSTNSKGKNNSC